MAAQARTVDEMIADMRQRRQKLIDLLALHVRTYGDAPMCLIHFLSADDSRRWLGVVIHPSPEEPGKLQVSHFDRNGFSWHHTAASWGDALRETITYYGEWELRDPAAFDELAHTPAFVQGCLRTNGFRKG